MSEEDMKDPRSPESGGGSGSDEDESNGGPEAEVEALLNEGVEVATQLLIKTGGFLPFGVAMTHGDEIHSIEPTVQEDDEPDAEEILGSLVAGLREATSNGEYRSIAIFLDVEIHAEDQDTESDAIHAGLEHESGFVVDVYVPYDILDGRVHLGEAIAGEREPVIFLSSNKPGDDSPARTDN